MYRICILHVLTTHVLHLYFYTYNIHVGYIQYYTCSSTHVIICVCIINRIHDYTQCFTGSPCCKFSYYNYIYMTLLYSYSLGYIPVLHCKTFVLHVIYICIIFWLMINRSKLVICRPLFYPHTHISGRFDSNISIPKQLVKNF